MIKYVPFLKAKQGELNAMSAIEPDVKEVICPFFDFPRRNDEFTSRDFPATADRIAQGLARHFGTDRAYYFDNRDLDESIRAGTKHNYAHMLEQLSATPVIPVVGIDRSDAHMKAVTRLKQTGVLIGDVVACRFSQEDFDSFDVVKNEIAAKLGPIIGLFERVDLILSGVTSIPARTGRG